MFAFIVAMACIALIVAWVRMSGMRPPTYSQVTIPIWAYSNHVKSSSIEWIDNDRVIFGGGDPNLVVPSPFPDRPYELMAIYIWDTKKNEYFRYKELNELGWMSCYENGVVKYIVQGQLPKGSVEPLEGFQGAIGDVQRPWNSRPTAENRTVRGSWQVSRFGCTSGWDIDLVRPDHVQRGYTLRHLRTGDGYLFAPTNIHNPNFSAQMSSNIELWHREADRSIKMPIMAKQLTSSDIYFSDYKNVYVMPAGIHENETNPGILGYQPGIERPVYYISRNGNVETISFPIADHIALGKGFLPTVAGYFVASNFTRRASSYDAGAWIIVDGRSHKIIDHLVEDFNVSPDGCKAIVSIRNPDKPVRYSRSMSVFDFCRARSSR